MEISIKWNICRVCLEEETKDKDNGQMRCVFANENMPKQIFEVAGVLMETNDGLPEKICRKCSVLYTKAIYFRKICRDSNDYLQKFLERTKSASTLFKQDLRSETAASTATADDLSFAVESEDLIEADMEDVKSDDADSEFNSKLKRKNSELDSEHESSKTTEQLPCEVKDKIGDISKGIVKAKNVKTKDISNGEEFLQTFCDENDLSDETETFNEAPTVQDTNVDEKQSEEIFLDLHDDVYLKQKEEESADKTEHNQMEIDDVDDDDDSDLINIKPESDDDATTTKNVKEQSQELYLILNDIKDSDNRNNDAANIDIIHDEDEEDCDAEDNDDDNVEYISIDGNCILEEINLDHEPQTGTTKYSTFKTMNADDIDNYVVDDDDDNIDEDQNSVRSTESSYIIHQNNEEYVITDYTMQDESDENSSSLRKKSIGGKNKFVVEARSKSSSSQLCSCSLCGNQFVNRYQLTAHMRIHTQDKAHECEICYKRFITACNLQAHMRIHTGERPFECQYCGRRFNDRSSHLRHERIHTNERPFKCRSCNKSFTLATTLQAHLKVHTGERNYRCIPCSKSFKLPHQLKAHQNTHLHKAIEKSN